MTDEKTMDEEQLIEDQLRTYGLMKFPENFMNIGLKTFSWVYANRAEWVKFSEAWETSTGLFKFWYLYVKLRASLLKKDDQPSDGNENGNGNGPVYTIPVADGD